MLIKCCVGCNTEGFKKQLAAACSELAEEEQQQQMSVNWGDDEDREQVTLLPDDEIIQFITGTLWLLLPCNACVVI